MKILDYFFTVVGGGVFGIGILFTIMHFLGKFSFICITLKQSGELMCTAVFR